MNPHRRVTIIQAAKLLSVPTGTLYSWASRGEIVPVGIERDGTKIYHLGDLASKVKSTRRRPRRY